MKLCMGCMREIEDAATVCPHCGYDESSLVQESYYLAPGTIIGGKYIVGRALSYSGYTVKYIGMDAASERRVMISEYLPSDFSTRSEGETGVTIYSGDALEQFNQGLMTFLNEGNRIQNLGAVQGIAQVYDCIAENDTGYLISEYLEGKTLQQILDTGKRFSPEEAKAFICEILTGLKRVHPMDIIHCDIAPETIFITQQREIKLLDFGSTRYVTTANSKSLAIILKQGYAPEEQYRSQGRRGPWTDVYALGAVMYRMITGKVPPESVDRALEDTIQAPSKFVPSIPKAMENALMNALNVYQEERTPSAEVFYQELNNAGTVRRKIKKKKRDTGRIPFWVKGLVAVVACTVLVGGILVIRVKQEEAQRQLASTSEERFSTGVGKPYQAFQKKWKKNGFALSRVEVEYRYDATVSEDIVKEFEDYTEDRCLVDGASVKSLKKKRSVKGDDMLARVVVASGNRYSFLPEWMNSFPQEADSNTTYDQKRFYGSIVRSGDESKPYGVVKTVTVDGKEQNKKELLKQTEPFYIKDSDGQKANQVEVSIYTGSYYMMKKNAAHDAAYYKGKKVSDIKFLYGKRGNWTEKSLEDSKYDKNYVSFTSDKGSIVEVLSSSLAKGKKYDGSKEGGRLFDTVGVKLTYGVTTVGQIKRWCRLKNNNKYKNDELVIWADKETFAKNAAISIKTKVKETPKPTEKPTPKPTQQQTEPQAPAATAVRRPASKPKTDTARPVPSDW